MSLIAQFAPDDFKYGHVFRKDMLNHVVVTGKAKVRRNSAHRLLCGPRLDDTYQRRIPGGTVTLAVTCPTCLRSMTALMDLLEREELQEA
jgi:hypothetical protein